MTSISLHKLNQRSCRIVQAVAAGILSHNPEPFSPPTATAPQLGNTDYLPSGTDVVSLLDREDRL